MRLLSSWLEGFEQYTAALPSPQLFRKWAAVSTISAALERKVWVTPFDFPLYPNTYVVLVGPAGAGKTIVTSQVQRFLRELSDHHVASSSLTKAALMDELNLAVRRIIRIGETPSFIEFNFLSIIANELGTLIPAYEPDFMNVLTDIYDGLGYSERRRGTKNEFNLPNAQFNLIAATTPSYLAATLPVGAWDQGFLSRTILVFSGESSVRPLFQSEGLDLTLRDNLIADLKEIAKLFGRVSFTPEAASIISEWHMKKGPPTPEHPKLVSYNTRRTTHLMKLCMIVCASEGDTLTVTPEHLRKALDLQIFTEEQMPDIFKAMNTGGDARAIEEVYYFALQEYTRTKHPVREGALIAFLSERVPTYSVLKLIEVVTKAGIFEERMEPGLGKCYIPRPQKKTTF